MSIRFDFPVVKPRYDEKQVVRHLPMQSQAPTERISEQGALVQTILADILKHDCVPGGWRHDALTSWRIAGRLMLVTMKSLRGR
jgi:hypothetical protein